MLDRRATRLFVLVAIIEMIVGQGDTVLGGRWAGQGLGSVTERLLPTVLMSGSIVLALLVRYPVKSWVLRALAPVPAASLVLLASYLATAGIWIEAVFGFTVGLAVLAAPWVPSSMKRFKGWATGDFLVIAVALAEGGVGLLALVAPGILRLHNPFSVQSFTPAIAMAGFGGAICFLFPSPEVAERSPSRLFRMLGGATLPLIMVIDSLRFGSWDFAAGWVAIVLALLIHRPASLSVSREKKQRFRGGGAGTPADQSSEALRSVEITLEMWTWLMVLAIALQQGLRPARMVSSWAADYFVLALSALNVLLHVSFPRLGSLRQRVIGHLLLLTGAIGLLEMVSHDAPLGHDLGVFLVVGPLLATRALGPTAGFVMMACSVVATNLGGIRQWVVGSGPPAAWIGESVVESLVMVLASWVGIRTANDQRLLVGQLAAKTRDLAAEREAGRQAEQALRESEERFRSAFEHAAIGKTLVGLDGKYLQVNRSFCKMVGYTREELVGRHFSTITHPDDLAEQDDAWRRLIAGEVQEVHLDKRYINIQERVVWAQVSLSLPRDQAGRPVYVIAEVQDFSERKRFEQQLLHLADHDPLTNLFNRRRFQEELEQELSSAKLHGTTGAVAFLDLDQFKDINDSLGHRSGDQILASLGQLLRGELRETDVLARPGGDEFAVVMPQVGEDEAERSAARLVEAIGKFALVTEGQLIRVTASIGVALFPQHGTTVEEIIAAADAAMYAAKKAGGNRFALHVPDKDWQERLSTRRAWEYRIKQALENEGFTLYCQPIMNLRTGRIERHEVLLRMLGPDNTLILPGDFLEIAERHGLIRQVDRWVVVHALRFMGEQLLAGCEVCLEVNLSGKALADSELLLTIRDGLAERGVDPANLVLEITETAAISNIYEAQRLVEALKSMGCRIALDDFGVGYSSFWHLKHLPVDFLKIDGSFIRNLPDDTVDQRLVAAMIEVARGLGKETIAEFVGDEATLQILRQCGADHAQGYYIGKPHPLEDLASESQSQGQQRRRLGN